VWIILGKKKLVGTLIIINGLVFLVPSIVVAIFFGFLDVPTAGKLYMVHL
jgi:hypothetical protein